jgi:NAD(P)H-quinone oxidoreductase subunit 5
VENGLRALITYRVCDVALLTAAVLMHHHLHTASFVEMFGTLPWPEFSPSVALTESSTLLGLLLIFAAIGKSAQIPATGWLPRAMEGPTPSSAIFYGALSVHAGAFLLLRCSALFEASVVARVFLGTVGTLTFIHSSRVGRVQTKAKSLLAYASSAQLGLIFVEIALGLRYFALAHMVGHACLRALQLLRSPSFLHDYAGVEGIRGGEATLRPKNMETLLPLETQLWTYRLSLERGFVDAALYRFLIDPIHSLGRLFQSVERFTLGSLGLEDLEGLL